MRIPIELLPTCCGSCSPAEYVRRVRSEPACVRSVRIQPPRLGQAGFGSLLVEYRTPVFATREDGHG
jgi:hypothetical protein